MSIDHYDWTEYVGMRSPGFRRSGFGDLCLIVELTQAPISVMIQADFDPKSLQDVSWLTIQ